jgi:xylan 1,4-beta-xylosidase
VDISKAAVILFETNYQGYRGGKSRTTHPNFVIEDINAGEASAYMLLAEGLDELPMREAT